jgi:hypothetical protein
MKSKAYNGEVRSSEKDFETLPLGAFATPGLLLAQRLCRNGEISGGVILNEVKNLDLLIDCKRRDPSAPPQDDIKTQSLRGPKV